MTDVEVKLVERMVIACERMAAAMEKAKPAERLARNAPVGGGAVFGNYGRNKGGPVAGASMADLTYYGDGCRRTLADPAKSNFHEREKALLAAIDAEVARQSGATEAPPDDDSIPF